MKAHPHFRVGTYGSENGIQTEDTTLVSQCSSDNLHHIEALVKRWKGPISIAVFAPGRGIVPLEHNWLKSVALIIILIFYYFNFNYYK